MEREMGDPDFNRRIVGCLDVRSRGKKQLHIKKKKKRGMESGSDIDVFFIRCWLFGCS